MKTLKYVSGNFVGNFYTHQKSALSIGEKIPEGGLHNVHIYKGELTEVNELDEFKPEDHLNRDGMLLHNVTNIQITPGINSTVKEKKIYDFDQLVLKNVEIVNSWEADNKTYGILKGELVGKIKKISSVPISHDNDSPIPPPPIGGGPIQPPPIGGDNTGWNKYVPPIITNNGNRGCFSTIWNILKWILLLLFILFLLKQCLAGDKNDGNEIEDPCKNKIDSLIIINDTLSKKLIELENEKKVTDSLQNEIEKRRKRDKGKTGEITISLIWDSIDDLDLAVIDPNGDWISHKNKTNQNILGFLDIDANYTTTTETPIENIYINKPIPGRYKVFVKWYKNRTKNSEIPYFMTIKNGEEFLDFDRIIYDETVNGKNPNWHTIYEFEYLSN